MRLQKISKNECVKETGPGYREKIISSDNPLQNIWYEIEKYSKIGQEFKSVISHFACFLAAIVNVYFFEGPLGAGLRLHPHLTFL